MAGSVRPRAGGRRRGINADDVVVETKPAGWPAAGGFPVHQATGGDIAVAVVQMMMHEPTRAMRPAGCMSGRDFSRIF